MQGELSDKDGLAFDIGNNKEKTKIAQKLLRNARKKKMPIPDFKNIPN